MPTKNEQRALSEVEEISRRFLAGELPLEEAARDIAQRLPMGDGFSLALTKDVSADDAARLKQLYYRALRLWEEMLDDDSQ